MIRSYRNNNNPCWRVSASVTTLTYGRGDTSHRAGPGNVPGHCCCLGCSCCLSCCCLLLHLPVTLTQIKHLAGDKTNAKIWWQDNILNEHSTIWLSTNIGRFNVTSTKFINYNMLLHMYRWSKSPWVLQLQMGSSAFFSVITVTPTLSMVALT